MRKLWVQWQELYAREWSQWLAWPLFAIGIWGMLAGGSTGWFLPFFYCGVSLVITQFLPGGNGEKSNRQKRKGNRQPHQAFSIRQWGIPWS
ncbi:hypothetical protein [Prochlorococcus marinus]|uniref:hypothetical protein n=1 Tax=Prochlorococcus marinus TaxID=1219 RepID=UPI00059DF817|nr:hypothetical protein [Prochlorococcus marinus]